MNIESCIRTSKLDGWVFKCPFCEQVIVKGLTVKQVTQLGQVHMLTCPKKPKNAKVLEID